MFHDADSEDPTFSEHARARPLQRRSPRSRARSAPRTGSRSPTPSRPSSSRWPSSTRTPPRRSATGATRRSRSPSRPPTRRPRTTTATRGRPRVFEPRAASGKSLAAIAEREAEPVMVTLEDGKEVELDHGRVVIAAITSCTNTSNPSVMIGAGLLAKKAVELGLERKPWVKTSLAPGLDRGHRLPRARRARRVPRPARLQPRRLRLHDLHRQLRPAAGGDLLGGRTRTTSSSARCSRATATSRAGSTRTCATTTSPRRRSASPTRSPGAWTSTCSTTPLGDDGDGNPVHLADIWPTTEEIKETIDEAVRQEMFERSYADVFTGDERWRELETPEGDRYTWPDSTYVRKPSFFEGMDAEPAPDRADHRRPGARGARRQRHHRPHLARRARSRRTARRAAG